MIRVQLPAHLRTLAGVEVTNSEMKLEIDSQDAITLRAVLNAIEERYPALRGTIRDHVTGQRRPFLRFFACGSDITHDSPDAPLPQTVAVGDEVLIILGAIAGG
jgi:molybdopterin synthase sulfur carrier subunit